MAPPDSLAGEVVVVHADGRMRLLLRMALEEDAGYAVAEASSCDEALHYLRERPYPAVVVTGNVTADYRAEADFFGRIAADPTLAGRHRFVLLATIPEWLPPALDATLRDLGVRVLAVPLHLHALLAAVAVAAGRACPTTGQPHRPRRGRPQSEGMGTKRPGGHCHRRRAAVKVRLLSRCGPARPSAWVGCR